MDEVFKGEVVWFDVKLGYGFIAWEKENIKQKDIFLHYSDIIAKGFKLVKAGQRVSFAIGKNKSGIDKAIEVSVIG